jgi:2-C-methyl-D-erythritol 4-phosphate cytidylyltransferase
LKFALIMPAAGRGERLGAAVPKALVEIGGRPLLLRSLQPFVVHPEFDCAVIAVPEVQVSACREIISRERAAARIAVVAGGSVRQESVALALDALNSTAGLVLIHDAVRPFVTRELVDRVLEAMSSGCVAAVPVLPVTDTIKRVVGDPAIVAETVDRSGLVVAQTPQALKREIAVKAYRLALHQGQVATDDVSLIELFALGTVRAVEGDPRNIKITTTKDLALARQWVEQEIGQHGAVH